MSNLIDRCQIENGLKPIEWEQAPKRTYACRAMICEDEDGGFFAYATRLPGVVGEGDTFQDAVESVKEGFESVLGNYLASGDIPWQDEVVHEQGTLVSLAIRVDG